MRPRKPLSFALRQGCCSWHPAALACGLRKRRQHVISSFAAIRRNPANDWSCRKGRPVNPGADSERQRLLSRQYRAGCDWLGPRELRQRCASARHSPNSADPTAAKRLVRRQLVESRVSPATSYCSSKVYLCNRDHRGRNQWQEARRCPSRSGWRHPRLA